MNNLDTNKRSPSPLNSLSEAIKSADAAATITAYSGPIPPQFLVQYEQLVPGSAKRILDALHEEAAHRYALEKEIV